MTPSARLAAAAEILDTLVFTHLIEPQLKAWGRSHRFAGSGDRRAIADRVYSCLRRMRSVAAHSGSNSGRALVLGSLAAEDGLEINAIESLCNGGYGLEELTEAERQALSSEPRFDTEAARLDWPDWLMPEAIQCFGASLQTELDALRRRAPLDLRVNTLRASVSDAQAALNEEGVETATVPHAKTALRAAAGTPIRSTAAYAKGFVDLQDASSQRVAAFTEVSPGQTVLDFCAGAGGKTLALAAMMQDKGTIYAHDIDPKRMADIPERSKRCGVNSIRLVQSSDQLAAGSCDAVLIDAPCSGSGSWRRDPLGKWRLTEERLAAIHEAQQDALKAAARYVRPGGTLVYATCSVLPSENHAQADWFRSLRGDFVLEETLNLWPARDGGDGFFAARFRNRD